MPRTKNPVAIAAGRLILALQKECSEAAGEDDASCAQKVMHRAKVLLQASQSSSARNLLDGRTVVDYLDAVWISKHPAVKPSIELFVTTLNSREGA